MKKILFVACITLLALLSAAQQPGGRPGAGRMLPIPIKGKVIDASTNQPMEYTSVSIFSMRDSSFAGAGITDGNGRFSIEVKGRKFYLIASFLGYSDKVISDIELTPDKASLDLGIIKISPSADQLDEVEVVAEKSQMQLQLDKRVFNVGKDLTSAGGNASDILDNVPSVEVDVEGNVSLRGSQNVRILIDGKPSGMVGSSPADALKLIQADLIDRIEVVTNPSARYEAEGEVGIINIILKKDRRKGVNGSITASTGYPHNHGIGANLNYRTGKVNLFGSYNFNYRRNPGDGYYYQESYLADTTLIYERLRDHERGGYGNTGRLGSDFYIKEDNILTFSTMYRKWEGNNEVNIVYNDFDEDNNLVNVTSRDESEEEDRQVVEVNARYEKQFEKKDQKFNLDFRWFLSDDTENSDILEGPIDADPTIIQRFSNVEDEQNWLVQSDYVHPFWGNGKLELGGRAALRTIDNQYKVEQQETGEWVILDGFNNSFRYQENIYAAYVMLGNKHGKFSWQGGLRTELTDITTEIVNDGEKNDKDYIDFFPSVHLSYELKKKNTVQLSYSRRLSRPWFRSLLPFSGFSDARNLYNGNPDLNPEYTNSVELGYLKNWEKGSLLSSVYYRHRTGVIQRITVLFDDLTSLMIPVNLSEQNAVGFEFNLSQELFKWWRLNLNANIYYVQTEGEYEGQDLSAEAFTASTRLSTRWKLPKDINIQISARVRAPRNDVQGFVKTMAFADLAISKDVLKGNGTLTFNIRDVFNTRVWNAETDTEELFRINEFQWRSRVFTLSFSYRINQKKGRGGNREGFDGGGEGGGF